jgi:hypothetical protein
MVEGSIAEVAQDERPGLQPESVHPNVGDLNRPASCGSLTDGALTNAYRISLKGSD